MPPFVYWSPGPEPHDECETFQHTNGGQLIQEGYILTRASSGDRRLKQLYCRRKGDRLLEYFSDGQRKRIDRAYENVSPRAVENYLKVMTAMLDSERRGWVRRLTEGDDPSKSV